MNSSKIIGVISKALGQKVTEILAALDKFTKGKSSKISELNDATSVKTIIKHLTK
jgi:hypothetical protein